MTLTNGNSYAYQWDVGLSVATDDPVGTEVRMANKHGSKSIPVLATQDGDNVVYKIPNILLTTGRDIVMYTLDGEGETTEHIVAMDELVVYEAQKPDDYVWTDAELRIWDSKINEPYIEGADGDVLRTDGEGGRYWGKVDYSEIENTPYIPEKTSDITNDSGYITAEDIPYIPEKTSDLVNDSGFITAEDVPPIPVQSVNGQTGAVVLNASNVGAIPDPAGGKVSGASLMWKGSSWVPNLQEMSELADVFICEYGDTSYDEIEDAVGGGFHIYCETADGFIPLTQNGSAHHTFSYISHDNATGQDTVISLICKSTGWTTETTVIGSGGGAVTAFICEYNVTSFSDVASAYSAGKSIYCKTGATIIPLTHVVGSTPSEFRFAYMHSANGSTVYRLTSSGWADAGATLTPTTRTINGHALSVDITLDADDVGAIATPSSPTDGDVLTYDSSTSAWKAEAPSGGASDFDDLGDIFIATYNSTLFADVLAAYNAGKSIYVKASLDGLTNEPYPLTSMSTNGTDITRFNFTIPKGTVYTEPYVSSSGWSYNTGSLVPQTRTVNNKALSSNITLDADDVGAIAAPSSPTTGDFLVWNGTAWAARSLSTWQGGSY